MNKALRTSFNSLHKEQDKGTYLQTQKKRVFVAFFKHPKTIGMVSIETGISRSDIRRYIAEWKKRKSIRIIRKDICPVSKYHDAFYSTNPELFPNIINLSNSKPKGNE